MWFFRGEEHDPYDPRCVDFSILCIPIPRSHEPWVYRLSQGIRMLWCSAETQTGCFCCRIFCRSVPWKRHDSWQCITDLQWRTYCCRIIAELHFVCEKVFCIRTDICRPAMINHDWFLGSPGSDVEIGWTKFLMFAKPFTSIYRAIMDPVMTSSLLFF